ncbi:MAG: response regulator [Desulfobaccales bacterium]
MSFKVLIVDDHRIMREGLRAMLEKEPDIKVVGDATDGRMAQLLARDLAPDVIIMDVNMPELNGIEATRQITAELSDVKIIALSMHEDRRFVLNMLKAGAAGYMLKDDAFKNLAKAVRMVAAHKTYLSVEIADLLENDCRSLSTFLESAESQLLSCREREVLQLVTEGKTSNQIADSLHISVKTVETHRQQVMEKLNIKGVAELTKYAIREGLTSL